MEEYTAGYNAAVEEISRRRIKTYKQMQARRKRIKQRIIGVGAMALGIIAPLTTGDGTISLILIPMGVLLTYSNEMYV